MSKMRGTKPHLPPRTPRGLPIMDVVNIPDDLPAPTTTRPLLSRTETRSLARSRTTSHTTSRDSSVSSRSAIAGANVNARSRVLPRVAAGSGKRNMEASSSSTTTTTKSGEDTTGLNMDKDIGGSRSGKASTSRYALEREDRMQVVPSSESPEPMDFDHEGTASYQRLEEAGAHISTSHGTKRKRTPTGDQGIGCSASQQEDDVEQGTTGASSSHEGDSMGLPLLGKQDVTDRLGESTTSIRGGQTVVTDESHSKSAPPPGPSVLQDDGPSSSVRPIETLGDVSGTRGDTHRDDELGPADPLDASQPDVDDWLKVQMMLDSQEDNPNETPVPSSSSHQQHVQQLQATSSNMPSGSSSPIPPPRRDKGKMRARTESSGPGAPPDMGDIIDITNSPPIPLRSLPPAHEHFSGKGKQKAGPQDLSFSDEETSSSGDVGSRLDMTDSTVPAASVDASPQDETLLSAYTCPICFCAPTNATLTPCGHICCGECLFTAIKTTMQRLSMIGPQDDARCPVCRAAIPGWDGKGGGVIGLKIRAVFSL